MTDRVRKDPLTGLEIEFVPAEGEPLPGGIGPASSNRVQDGLCAYCDREFGEWHKPDCTMFGSDAIPNRGADTDVIAKALRADSYYHGGKDDARLLADSIVAALGRATRNREVELPPSKYKTERLTIPAANSPWWATLINAMRHRHG